MAQLELAGMAVPGNPPADESRPPLLSAQTPTPASPPPAQEDPDDVRIAEAVASLHSDRAKQVRQALYETKDLDPERHAQVLKLAEQTGLPASTVARNFDGVAARAQLEDIDAHTLAAQNPNLAEWLAKPDNAAVAKDN